MSISDNDLQVMEEWLDGELPEEQAESLRQRLSSEPELAQAMARLRDERQIRSRLFTLLESGDTEAEPLIAEIRRGVRREELWTSRMRSMKKLTSLAAAIVLVFMAGWITRERLQVGNPPQPNKVLAQNPIPLRGGQDNHAVLATMRTPEESGRLRFDDRRFDLSALPVAMHADDGRQQVYQVVIDPNGNLFVLQPLPRGGMKPSIEPFQFQSQLKSSPSQQSQGVLVNTPAAPGR